MPPNIVQIVRRFGPVGGMETYVWRLTKGLAERGYSVSVICEEVCGEIIPTVEVLQTKRAREKPRWISMLMFRARVDFLLKQRFKGKEVIVHSHERSLSHQITTFHGSPICAYDKLRWVIYFSPRIRGWKKMERHELLSNQVEWVLPVSSKVRDSLFKEYPELLSKRLQLGWPGVDKVLGHGDSKKSNATPERFVFVGKEWKRKGLLRAIDIIEIFRESHSNASFDVYGVDSSELPRTARHLPWIKFCGWSASIPWMQYDVLLHPAESEPFGMVVSEARAHGLAVLLSDQVGAADLSFNHASILSSDAPLREWVSELTKLVSISRRSFEVKWAWDDLVDMHCNTIYSQVEAKAL